MNKNKLIIFLIMIFLWNQHSLTGQSIPSSDKVELPDNQTPAISNTARTEEESTLRRLEVVFLLSLPFTTIMSLVFFNGVYYLSDTSYNWTLTRLPHEMLPFAIFSAAFTSGIITYADYRTVQDKKNKLSHLSNTDETRELQLGVGIEKKF